MKPLLVLASTSASRRALMENAGLEFSAVAANIDEREVEKPLIAAGMGPAGIALGLARAKALSVSAGIPGAFVVGCDQTMSLGERLYHKPADRAEALAHLASLSGRTHRLNSALAIARDGEIIYETVSHADMSMRQFSDDYIGRYLDRNGEKVLKSVGAYQLEGEGIRLFESIDGDYFTILGLPLMPLLGKLRELELIDG